MAGSSIRVSPHFDHFIFDWDYEIYLLIGAYGSGKSYAIAEKIILKLLMEKRKCVVFRDVYRTIQESTFDLIREILQGMNLLATDGVRAAANKVVMKRSPLSFCFPNGSRIIFNGMDSTEKIKSLNGASIVWIEECTEISQDAYLELLGRVRMPPGISMHFILSCNPVSRTNWVYQNFFAKTNEYGTEDVIMDEQRFYKKRIVIKNGVYYHHSICEDNPFVDKSYIQRLDKIRAADKALWMVARLGRFGTTGLRVLPRFEVLPHDVVLAAASGVSEDFHKIGFDFGFEKSYNALTKSAFDKENLTLYIYDEYYRNQMTDEETAAALQEWDDDIKSKMISADNAEPKSIRYYQQKGFKMRACKKTADSRKEGSRIANTKKFKRLHRIVCSSKCKNTIRELKDLTYKKKKDGEVDYGHFNIDPHTFSSLWYAWDLTEFNNCKVRKNNSWKGGA